MSKIEGGSEVQKSGKRPGAKFKGKNPRIMRSRGEGWGWEKTVGGGGKTGKGKIVKNRKGEISRKKTGVYSREQEGPEKGGRLRDRGLKEEWLQSCRWGEKN